jgi:hypothetical protein
MMRPDAKGVLVAVDPLGRELARGEYYTTDRLDIVAMMPVHAVPTLYSRIGDVVAYVCILALINLDRPGLRTSAAWLIVQLRPLGIRTLCKVTWLAF